MIPHISFSAWNLWKECQQKFKISEIDKQRVQIHSVHMDFGTAVHESIESYRCKKLDERVSVEKAQELFESKFRKLREADENKTSTKDLENMLKAGRFILSSLHKCNELESAEVMFNELPLFESISRSDDLDVKFKGFIDIILKTKNKRGGTVVYICDFKTCSWGWSGEKRRDKQTANQLFLYKYFFCKKFNVDPDEVKVAFILLKKRPKNNESPIEWFYLSSGPVPMQRAIDSLNSDLTEIHLRIQDGKFVKNRKACKNQYGDFCSFFGTEKCPD